MTEQQESPVIDETETNPSADPQTAETADVSTKSRDSNMRVANQLLFLSLITIPVTLYVKGSFFIMSPAIGAFLALAALACVFIGYSQSRQAGKAEGKPRTSLLSLGSFWLSDLLFLGQIALIVYAVDVSRTYTQRAGVSSEAASHLRAIGQALYGYNKRYRAFPPTLAQLTPTFLRPEHLISSLDPDAAASAKADGTYSSYVYHPGSGHWKNDDNILTVYEKQAWLLTTKCMFPEHKRWVIATDGYSKLFNEEEFHEALQRDSTHRSKLGWPVFREQETK